MLSKSARVFLVVVALGFSAGVAVAVISLRQGMPTTEAVPLAGEKPVVSTPKPKPTQQAADEIPDRIVLNVPFYSQAPFGIWDELHGEACEEASLHMVRDYYRKASLDLEEQDQLLLDFIHWQTDNGYKVDLTLSQLAAAAKAFHGFSGAQIIQEPTLEEIKGQLAKGNPVIIPAAGRILENPHFRSPGPIYHMLVIKGYDKNGFITNDPGTRHGEGFRYSYENLMKAMHDWNPAEITDGAKAVMVYQRD